ncbi:MAG: cache domain-containing protein, partial [Planctomycetota bacterium]
MKQDIRDRTYEAFEIASNIYRENKERMNENKIKKIIKDALRPIRFNHGRGYFFAVSINGVEQLYPIRPELEGESLTDLQDLKGNYVIREEIKIIKS